MKYKIWVTLWVIWIIFMVFLSMQSFSSMNSNLDKMIDSTAEMKVSLKETSRMMFETKIEMDHVFGTILQIEMHLEKLGKLRKADEKP